MAASASMRVEAEGGVLQAAGDGVLLVYGDVGVVGRGDEGKFRIVGQSEVGPEAEHGLAQLHLGAGHGDVGVEQLKLHLQELILRVGADAESLLGYGVELLCALVAAAGHLEALLGAEYVEEIGRGRDGDALHVLEVHALGHLVALGLGLLLPLEAVVLEDGLVVGDVDGVGVVGHVPEGVQGYGTSGERDVLVDGQLQGVVHVVVLDVVGLTGLGVLQGHDGAVVLSQVGPEVQRGQELRPVRTELPVAADERVPGHQRRQRLALRHHDYVLEGEVPVARCCLPHCRRAVLRRQISRYCTSRQHKRCCSKYFL